MRAIWAVLLLGLGGWDWAGAGRVKVVVAPGTPELPWFSIAPRYFKEVAGVVYFGVDYLDGSAVLWRTQGTEASTVPVKVFAPSASDRRVAPVAGIGQRLLFFVWTPEAGTEPWVTDGTEAGTSLVRDWTPGPESSSAFYFAEWGSGMSFFRFRPGDQVVELWRMDGTAEGFTRLADLGRGAVVASQQIRIASAQLFFLTAPGRGKELWRMDGSVAGTRFVTRLDAEDQSIDDVGTTEDGQLGLFTLRDGVNMEVWRSDGTPEGTVRLETFGNRRWMRLLGSLGSFVYLADTDPVTRRMGLFRVALAGGGKSTVTYLPDLYPNEPGERPFLHSFARSGGRFYFGVGFVRRPLQSIEVSFWVTDGTAANTQRLPSELRHLDEDPANNPNSYDSSVYPLDGGGVVFSGAYSHTSIPTPWASYGTHSTTAELTTSPPHSARLPWGFARGGDRIYFTARDDTGRHQLWAVPARVLSEPALER